MKKGVCAAYVRKEIKKAGLVGPAAIAVGGFFLWLDLFTGGFRDPRNILPKIVVLFCFAGGGYLIFDGLRALLVPKKSSLCRLLQPYLHPDEQCLSAAGQLAVVDRDLDSAVDFAGGRVLAGREWLFVRDAWGTPIIRLERLQKVERIPDKDKVHLKFLNERGAGPVTGPMTSAEADRIKRYLETLSQR